MNEPLDAWYSYAGIENDVVQSSRVRLARNLVNFVFPAHLSNEDAERVKMLIFDAFSHIEEPEHYKCLQLKDLDSLGQRILTERGVYASNMYAVQSSAGVIRSDGKVSAVINVQDHLRLAVFNAGFSLTNCFEICKDLDEQLQDFLQFAASSETGYFTESVMESGTGMKASVILHLPSIATSGRAKSLFEDCLAHECKIQPCFGTGYKGGVPLGAYYILQNNGLVAENEFLQLDQLSKVAEQLISTERDLAVEFETKRVSILKDSVYRAVALLKYCRLLESKESIDLLSRIKWGISCNILEGINHTALTALLYRIQTGHLLYALKNGSFIFEDDILSEENKIERLRALIIQEALEKLKILA